MPTRPGYFFLVDFLFACARSDPATDRTVLLLLVRNNFDALLASFFDVVIGLASPFGMGFDFRPVA
jgi:hypothetical protein